MYFFLPPAAIATLYCTKSPSAFTDVATTPETRPPSRPAAMDEEYYSVAGEWEAADGSAVRRPAMSLFYGLSGLGGDRRTGRSL